MLIDDLKNDSTINSFIEDTCCENGFAAKLDPNIDKVNYAIIKVDKFYNSLSQLIKPPSPDCLIIIKCNDTFHMFIVELKDIKSSKYFDKQNIRDKFETCINDFISGRFRQYFLEKNYEFKQVKLYFVTDPYKQRSGKISKFNKGTKIDALLAANTKPIRFLNFRLGIEHFYNDPTINPC